MARQLSMQAIALLGSYVYIYSDPQTGEPFYVGKGKGGRAFAHLDSASGAKGEAIERIRARGLQPRIDILRYGLNDKEALLVEAAAIDLIGKKNLTNVVSGFTGGFGRIGYDELHRTLTAETVAVKHPAILFKISRLYHAGMSAEALYEMTRAAWKVGARREKAEYAIALYHGVAKEVYRINRWHPAGTLTYNIRDISDWKWEGRWEFSGEVAEDAVRELYVGNKMHIRGKKINVQSERLYANI